MQILLSFLIIIIKGLIKIGDGVLLVFDAVKLSFLLIKSKIQTRERSIAPSPKLSLPKKKLIVKIKKTNRPKRIVFFPLPFILKFKYFFAGSMFSLIFVFIPLILFVFFQDLPSPRSIWLGQIPQTTKIYDRNGTLLHQVYTAQNRTMVPLSSIPINLQNATIAIEDKDFYKHPGFDITAITRSAIGNAKGKELQGGSTITQQLIKSALLSPQTSMMRKVKEVILAFWTERLYSKSQILEMYFNQIPYGGTAWGVETATEMYFDKKVEDLDLAQSAFLAGIPRSPTSYSPFITTSNLWKIRQKEVLNRMVELGYISKDQAKEAYDEKLEFRSPQTPLYAPHFVMYVKDFLIRKYGLPMVEKGGLVVKTTLDLKLQDKMQKIVRDQVDVNRHLNLSNGAALITNPKNGDILAMIGSRNYSDPKDGNVNLTTSLRQPGSSIKLITYAAALSGKFTAASILVDSPANFSSPGAPPYSPVNYDGKFHGRVSLRSAFGNSLNLPAVKTLNQIGVPTFVSLAKEMGIKSWGDNSQYGLSITLGAADVTMLDIASAYGVVANGGKRVDLNPILEISDSKGNLIEEKIEEGKQVLDEGVAFIISSILADNSARTMEFGPNSPLNIPGKTVSVKTGTSDNKRDNWTIGYTPSYVVATWVGNNDNSPMSQSLASGITGAAPMWNKIMTSLIANSPDEKPAQPTDIVQKNCLGRPEYFIKGTENSINCAALSTPLPTKTITPSH